MGTACPLFTGKQQPQHNPAPAPTCSAGWKPGRDSGSYCCPPDLLFLQAFLQADFAPDTGALAESNLKGFANISMVLIETNIHQSAPCFESTSSGKDHVSPARSDTVSRQWCQNCLGTGSRLPALPVPRGTSPNHPPSQHTAPTGPWCWRREEVNAAGEHEGTPHRQNVPCGRSTQARADNLLGGRCEHQAQLLCAPINTCMENKAPCTQDHHADKEMQMSFSASSATCLTQARRSEATLADVIRREICGVRHILPINPGYTKKEHL